MRIRPATTFGKRGSKRMHLERLRLASYPAAHVAVCGVQLGVRVVGNHILIAYQDFQVTCPACRKLGPWHKRSG